MQKVEDFQQQHPMIYTLAIVLLVAGVGTGGYFGYKFWTQYNSVEGKFQRESTAYKNEWEDLMKRAGQQVKLPKDEVPVLATVTDPQTLPKNKFFQKALPGDRVMMYKRSGNVFLYRPSEKKIVAKAKLKFDESDEKVAGMKAEILGITPGASQSGEMTPTKATIPLN